LRESEAADRFPALQARQPAILLLVRAVGIDWVHDERALHGDETTQAGIAALDLLHDQSIFGIAHSRAAITLEIGAKKPEFGHLRDEFGRKPRIAKTIADQGRDALIGKAASRLAHHEFLLAEERIDREVIYAAKGHQEYSGIVRSGARTAKRRF